jgi:hypothetical protein
MLMRNVYSKVKRSRGTSQNIAEQIQVRNYVVVRSKLVTTEVRVNYM